MRLLLSVLFLSSLCACSSMSAPQMSYSGTALRPDPSSPDDPRLRHRAFYENEPGTPDWMKVAPQSNE
jgi:hypothetical protein